MQPTFSICCKSISGNKNNLLAHFDFLGNSVITYQPHFDIIPFGFQLDVNQARLQLQLLTRITFSETFGQNNCPQSRQYLFNFQMSDNRHIKNHTQLLRYICNSWKDHIECVEWMIAPIKLDWGQLFFPVNVYPCKLISIQFPNNYPQSR